MTIQEILQKAIELDAADIFLIAGLPVTYKCGGRQERSPESFLRPDDISTLVDSIYELSHRSRTNLDNGIDDDFSFAVSQMGSGSGCPTRRNWEFRKACSPSRRTKRGWC